MKTFLVVGLESSCTKFVSNLLALNLNIIDKPLKGWDGNAPIENNEYRVVHRSLPHWQRENFISLEYASSFDNIIICTRDFYCSLLSKNKIHQLDKEKANLEHERGVLLLKEIFNSLEDKITIFSYESSFLLGDSYVEKFLRKFQINNYNKVEILDINRKYLKNEAHVSK